MSDNNLPPLEGPSECEGNEDECSDSSESLVAEGHLSNEEDEFGFSHSHSFDEDPSRFYTLAIPEDTTTPVGSPRESLVGVLIEKFEPRSSSESAVASAIADSIVDCEESGTKVESMGRGSPKKESAKMNLSMYIKQVKQLETDVNKLQDKFKKLADKKPPPKEELNKSILENTVMMDRIKRKNNSLNALADNCVTETDLNGVMELESSLSVLETILLDISGKAKDLMGGGTKVNKETSSHLPKLDVPKFKGEMREYKLWKQRFDTITFRCT